MIDSFSDNITKSNGLWLLSTLQADQLLQSYLYPPCGPLLPSLECFKVSFHDFLEIFLVITETNSAIWIIQPITGAGHVQLCSKELIDNIYFSNWIQYCEKHNQVPRARHVLLCQKLHHTQQHCWGTILTSSSNMAIIYIFVFADTWMKLFIL